MLSGFFEKAVTATISLGMMVFSSYQGNTPLFIDSGATHRGNRITVQATLDNAFNDDFRQILQAGQEVAICFHLELRSATTTEIIDFDHIAKFDPLLETWTLTCEERDREYTIESWNEFTRAASDFNYVGNHYLEPPIEVHLEASLPKINLGQNNREFNLMLFWNYHKPSCQANLR
ncbi:MAG: hypothetical protein K9N06_01750 [Candidatus Cloacimonetes bacterium]|nr:hypothetical protein [Candidatus Cloacimonadota bacterium]